MLPSSRRTLGKCVYGKSYRGFESHSLRQICGKNPTDKKNLNKALFMGKIGHKNMLILIFREILKLVL